MTADPPGRTRSFQIADKERDEEKVMIRKTRLFTPGPTPLLPAAQFAMAAADIHHRTPEFRVLFQKVLAQLKAMDAYQDTAVVFLSDNGANAESGPNGRLEGAQPGATGSTRKTVSSSGATLRSSSTPSTD